MKGSRHIKLGDLTRLIGVHSSINNLEMAQEEKRMRQSILLREAGTPHFDPEPLKIVGCLRLFFQLFLKRR